MQKLRHPTPSSLVGLKIDKWKLERQLGEGGMSVVYLGKHEWLPTKGAVKVLRPALCDDPNQIERFRREAIAASELDHENVIHVHDFGYNEESGYFMVLEYLDGQDLDHFIDDAPFPKEWILNIIRQVCSGLTATHEAGIIHRDLKPSNIFLLPGDDDGPPKVKILDFGIAKNQGNNDKKLTATGSLVGTPAYLAPEQVNNQGKTKLTSRADIYAIGVLLYQMFTGELPIEREGFIEHFIAVLQQPPEPMGVLRPSLAGTKLEALVMRLLDKNPNNRPQSTKQLWEDLEEAAAHWSDPLSDQPHPIVKARQLPHMPLPTADQPPISPQKRITIKPKQTKKRHFDAYTPTKTAEAFVGDLKVESPPETPKPAQRKTENRTSPPPATRAPKATPTPSTEDPALADTQMELEQPDDPRKPNNTLPNLTAIVVLLGSFVFAAVWLAPTFFPKPPPKPPIIRKRKSPIRKQPNPTLALLQTLMAEGTKAFQDKDYKKAFRLWKRVSKMPSFKKKKHYKLYKGMGVALARQNLHYSAMVYYKRFLKFSPRHDEEYNRIDKSLLPQMVEQMEKRTKKAERLVKQLLRLLRQKRWSSAYKVYEKILKVAPSAPSVHEQMAKKLQRLMPQQAVQIYQKMLDSMELTNEETKRILSRLASTKQATQKEDQKLTTQLTRVRRDLKKGRYKKGKRRLERLLKQHPTLIIKHSALFQMLRAAVKENLDEALWLLKQIKRQKIAFERRQRSKWPPLPTKNVPSLRSLNEQITVIKNIKRFRKDIETIRYAMESKNPTKAAKAFRKLAGMYKKMVRLDKWKLSDKALEDIVKQKKEVDTVKKAFSYWTQLEAKLQRGQFRGFDKYHNLLSEHLSKHIGLLKRWLSLPAFRAWLFQLDGLQRIRNNAENELTMGQKLYKKEQWVLAAKRFEEYIRLLPKADNIKDIKKKYNISRCSSGVTWKSCKEILKQLKKK